MRRDSNDRNWKEVKEEVVKRDKGVDRMMRVLSILDYVKLKKNAGSFINIIDPAHIISVSASSKIMYEKSNIISLNRFSHSNLDSYRDPIDGHSITKEEVRDWWLKLLKANKEQEMEFYKLLEDNNLSDNLIG